MEKTSFNNHINSRNRFSSVSYNSIQNTSKILLIIWVCCPLLIMLLNLAGVDGIYVYLVWTYVLYFVGATGLIVGLLFFTKIISDYKLTVKRFIKDFYPLFFFFLFLIWALICCLLAENKRMAFSGSIPMTSSWFTFLFYGGFMLASMCASSNKSSIVCVARILLFVSTIQALVTIRDNNISARLNTVEPYTNCLHCQSVFYNTNHYAYYLLMTAMLAFFFVVNSNSRIEQILNVAIFVLLLDLLILNDTFGAYLALALTILFVLIWEVLSKGNKKRIVVLLVLIFVCFSLFSLAFTDNLKNNFISLFSDVQIIGSDENIDGVGSGRGELWKNALMCIKSDPVFGCGFENHGAYLSSDEYIEKDFVPSPHNFILFFAKHTGIPGLVLYLSGLIISLIGLIRKKNKIPDTVKTAAFIVIGYLISAFFGVAKFYTTPYYVIALGVCVNIYSDYIEKLKIT